MKDIHGARALLAVLALASVCGAHAAGSIPPATRADCDSAGFATVLQPAPDRPAQAQWFSRERLRWPGVHAAADGSSRYLVVGAAPGVEMTVEPGQPLAGGLTRLPLVPTAAALPAALAQRFGFVAAGLDLQLPRAASARLPTLLRQQHLLVETDPQGRVRRATALQLPGVLDDLYASAENLNDLGVRIAGGHTAFRLWAPTAQAVNLCLYADGSAPARALLTMQRDARTGAWRTAQVGDLSGGSYRYLVDVFVRGTGWVRNLVTDPYSISLNTDSARSWIGRLDHPALQPPGWATAPRPPALAAPTDAVIYELHVRDFSASDASVPAADRGKYAAFTHASSNGMRHLRALAAAGVTDLHLLPIFDLATVPEAGCVTPDPAALAALPPDSDRQQAAVRAVADRDCYNWGYDPWHYNAPEGSYASQAEDGAVRIVEVRRMVQALHAAGLRVGMDLVFNHTAASGQQRKSVLDRTVPGYYQRLNAQGQVETSTCCANTATEHRMMAKLMIDSAALWAREYAIDSFRFDLMGHQPRAAMERLQAAVNQAAGRPVRLIGEGWNFGEIANGARFVQASQASLNGSGIATFSDRGRDAVRGGGCCDDAAATLSRQGWINGLFYAPNGRAQPSRDELLRTADLVRVGLAGTLRGYRMTTGDGSVRALSDIDYAGQPAGYASQPDEVVNYVENHDNRTLFDINVLKLPVATTREDRARVQVLGLAVTAFSQGIAYIHAGVELLRSKSLDRNSYDSGDWFNRIDWTATDNHYGSGLPPEPDNGPLWPAMRPLLADAAIKPGPAEIAYTRDAFFDLLRIRASSALFRLRTADAVAKRLTLHNTGPAQEPTVVVGQLDGRGLAGAGFAEVLYAINVNPQPVLLPLPALRGRAYHLHPVHLAADAADQRPAEASRWDAASGTLTLPPRTALAYVLD
jgi:pullulanase-type alpha-1,6-glucosidase